MSDHYIHPRRHGFTIVELLIVIVVIGILASITMAAFGQVQLRAAKASLQSDIKNAATQLELGRVEAGTYRVSAGVTDSASWLSSSPGTTYQYSSDGAAYCLSATSSRMGVGSVSIKSGGAGPIDGVCGGHDDGATPSMDEFSWKRHGGSPGGMISSALATSADGRVLYSASGEAMQPGVGAIHKSVDGGESWQQLDDTAMYGWSNVATSADGRVVVGSYIRDTAGTAFSGGIASSRDGGSSWTYHTDLPIGSWRAVAVSADGSTTIAGWEIGHMFTSTDSGETWRQSTSYPTRRWGAATLSSDGQYAYASTGCGSNQGFVRSVDRAGSWIDFTTNPRCTRALAASANGQIVYASTGPSWSTIYKSTDGGGSWVSLAIPNQSSSGASNVATSADGRRVAITVGASTRVHVSVDGGTTWTSFTTPDGNSTAARNVRTLTASADGSTWYATNFDNLYKGSF